ncbi:DNA-formamidopyrimidine glycosylase family protein [Nannocystis radixulma]|uniref:DNA-(apurinic or apyrimidinic site) lyase n=1 Tax=Nannocystis radixulma TaxID=2995305 RepID=A0ABT5BMV3_9BACT|nr:DNA-formamidopyrimidine glycosylase family protein [Nannocystis radixulma]MDC0674332.1 Fpg/Nei family DNA glycosylase [Nannocystis radixulma]
MPEGDTLFKVAARLRVMVGETVTRFESILQDLDLVGRTITGVEARGKNLLIWFDGTHALYTHLRMAGSWHLYAPGSAWRKPAAAARVVLATASHVAVCFYAPVVEWLTAWEVGHHPTLAGLGPDLLGPEEPEDTIAAALARLRDDPHRPLGEALLDQRLVAGLGNVYKSELLWMERLDPFKPVSDYDDSTLRRLLTAGRTWMRRNLGDGPRRTRWGIGRANTSVYNRSGEPCPRCGAAIAVRRQGTLGRTTYYCPQCQQAAAAVAPPRGRVMVRGPAR